MKKRILSVALMATMLCSLLAVPISAKIFPDTAGHWAQNAIAVWSDRNVVNGDDVGNFRPNDPITRAEVAKMIDNLVSFGKTSNKVFPDVATDAWYASSVNKLYAAEVMTGYEDGTIRPGNYISRQEAAVILGRAFVLNTKNADQSLLAGFSDNDQIQDWARPTVAYMAGLAFVQGSDGNFRPGDPITRAEVITIIDNMVGVYADGSQDTYTGDYGDKIAIIKAPAIFNGATMGGAVVCGNVKGKVNFNSGSKINGCLCNWSANASVSTAGATVASTANKNGGSISAGGNFNAGYGGSSAAGGSSGGSVGGGSAGGSSGGSSGSSSTQYNVVFHANGGNWGPGVTQGTVTYALGNSYALRLPSNPTRPGFDFDAWYTNPTSADNLNPVDKLDPLSIVNYGSPKNLYAGWKRPSGLFGTVSVATGANVADRGKSASELMDNVTLVESTAIDTYAAVGGLRYVTGYTNSPTLNTQGNFLALTYTLPATIDNPAAVILKTGFSDGTSESTYSSFSGSSRSYTRVFEISAADLGKDIFFTLDMDGSNTVLNTIAVDLTELVRYKFVNVSTTEELVASLADKSAEKITLDAPITLTSGTYGSATNRKTLEMNAPISIAKDAAVTLQNIDIITAGNMATIIDNAPEPLGPVAPPADGEPIDGTPASAPSKAASLTLSHMSITTTGTDSVLNELCVAALTVESSSFRHATLEPSTAMVIGIPEEGDTVVLKHNTFSNYSTALEYKGSIPLNTPGNVLENNGFCINTTDIKLNASGIIPNIAYNYFDDAPAIEGPEGAVTNYQGPLYTDPSCVETSLTENLHDAYIVVDGTLYGKLSATETLSLTFAPEKDTLDLQVIPADVRDTTVLINAASGSAMTLEKANLPAELTIQIGSGEAKVITLSQAAA